MLDLVDFLTTPELLSRVEDEVITIDGEEIGLDQAALDKLVLEYPVLNKKFLAINRKGENVSWMTPNLCDSSLSTGIIEDLSSLHAFTEDKDIIHTSYVEALLSRNKIIIPFVVIVLPRKRKEPLILINKEQFIGLPLLPIRYTPWLASKSTGRLIKDWVAETLGYAFTHSKPLDGINFNMSEARTAYSPIQLVVTMIEINQHVYENVMERFDFFELSSIEEVKGCIGNDNRLSSALAYGLDLAAEKYGNKKK